MKIRPPIPVRLLPVVIEGQPLLVTVDDIVKFGLRKLLSGDRRRAFVSSVRCADTVDRRFPVGTYSWRKEYQCNDDYGADEYPQIRKSKARCIRHGISDLARIAIATPSLRQPSVCRRPGCASPQLVVAIEMASGAGSLSDSGFSAAMDVLLSCRPQRVLPRIASSRRP